MSEPEYPTPTVPTDYPVTDPGWYWAEMPRDPWRNLLPVRVCHLCGGYIQNPEAHTLWHQGNHLNDATRKAVDRAIENLRNPPIDEHPS